LINEISLKTHFYAGLDAATSTFSQSVLPQGIVTQGFQEAVSNSSRVDQSVALLRPHSATTHANRSIQPVSRTLNPHPSGSLVVPSVDFTAREEIETEGQVDVDLGAFSITENEPEPYPSRRYCFFVCCKQGNFASECPLISEKDRK
jgi:hypothetical protein